jgi:transposase-like protein
MEPKRPQPKYSPELRERAVRLVKEQRGDYPSLWAAVEAIAPKLGCVPSTLLAWVQRAEIDSGARPGLTSEERDKIKALERENRELRQANEILRKASAYFAQAELDRRWKP